MEQRPKQEAPVFLGMWMCRKPAWMFACFTWMPFRAQANQAFWEEYHASFLLRYPQPFSHKSLLFWRAKMASVFFPFLPSLLLSQHPGRWRERDSGHSFHLSVWKRNKIPVQTSSLTTERKRGFFFRLFLPARWRSNPCLKERVRHISKSEGSEEGEAEVT